MKKIALLLILLLPFAIKAGTISLSGTKTISPGETVTLPVVVSSSNKINGAQAVITVDGDDFEVLIKKTTSSYKLETGSNNFLVYTGSLSKFIPNKGTAAKIYVKAKSTATPGATATLTLKKVYLSTLQNDVLDDETCANYTTTLTVGEPKSTNNYLSSLEVTGYTIAFDKDTTTYSIKVNEPGSALKVNYVAEDEKATVKVSSPTLVEGTNKITVTVTAESGAKRVYTINVTVPTKEVATNTAVNLKTLEVKGYNIGFSPDKTEYILNVENDVKTVEINSTLEDSASTKNMTGPSELKDGENVYEITVKDKDGNKKVYRVTINRKEAQKECEECQVCEECKDGDTIWKFLAIALVIVTLAETIYMITMRDKKQI